MIHYFEISFFTHGLNLADDFKYKAFFQQFFGQIGIQYDRDAIIFFRYITFLLAHFNQQIILGQFYSNTIHIKTDVADLQCGSAFLIHFGKKVQFGKFFAGRDFQISERNFSCRPLCGCGDGGVIGFAIPVKGDSNIVDR